MNKKYFINERELDRWLMRESISPYLALLQEEFILIEASLIQYRSDISVILFNKDAYDSNRIVCWFIQGLGNMKWMNNSLYSLVPLVEIRYISIRINNRKK